VSFRDTPLTYRLSINSSELEVSRVEKVFQVPTVILEGLESGRDRCTGRVVVVV
jgi:hypothetical protein